MTLRYLWENVTVNHETYGYICPHTREIIEDVRYEFEIEPTDTDILDYLLLKGENKESGKKVLDFLNECGAIDYDTLEKDTDFVAFMTERYENDAWGDFQAGNDSY